ncbi:hypothetical protein TELCIR_03422 [Teladorsagia circumcincta]|uniref:Uncharacterized protein n=1 Tax=Teladorsagia circumcincta TaxID=45464 RepID=A0A2G9UYK2_TELCI|nr:hypothetical protein TELCIR_03422 [Teladorsagia circumcincta]
MAEEANTVYGHVDVKCGGTVEEEISKSMCDEFFRTRKDLGRLAMFGKQRTVLRQSQMTPGSAGTVKAAVQLVVRQPCGHVTPNDGNLP